MINKRGKLAASALSIIAISAILAFVFLPQQKLDTSSEESLKASLSAMGDSLDEKEKENFSNALQVLFFSNIKLGDVFSGISDTNNLTASTLKQYDGKTASELIIAAEKIKAERKKEQIKQALEEIKDIEQKIQRSETNKGLLSKVEVIKSRFYTDNSGYISQPIIEITTKNGTEKPISKISFQAVLASPDRSVPWIQDRINYEINGGLEVGETANWKLAPNMFSEWGQTKAPKDTILTLQVIQIDDAEGKEYASDEGSNKEALERLRKLKEFVLEN